MVESLITSHPSDILYLTVTTLAAGTTAVQGCVRGATVEEPRVVCVYVCAVVDGWMD